MLGKQHQPGKWPDLSEPQEYRRLVALARRRLIGHEHHAEDVVSRAVIRWYAMSAEKNGVAQIEQVIKSEAYSLLRSERRARNRDTASLTDRGLGRGDGDRAMIDPDIVVLRRAIAHYCVANGIVLGASDVEVLELLFAGYSMAEIMRTTNLSRYEVKSSRALWRRILRAIDLGDGPSSP